MQKLSTAAVASQHLSFKLNCYEEPDPVKKTQNSVIKKDLMIALMTQSSQAILLCRISDLLL